jgi:replicative DNA helicase
MIRAGFHPFRYSIKNKNHHFRTKNKIGLIVIDYLQLMSNSKSKTENRVQELSQITRS